MNQYQLKSYVDYLKHDALAVASDRVEVVTKMGYTELTEAKVFSTARSHREVIYVTSDENDIIVLLYKGAIVCTLTVLRDGTVVL